MWSWCASGPSDVVDIQEWTDALYDMTTVVSVLMLFSSHCLCFVSRCSRWLFRWSGDAVTTLRLSLCCHGNTLSFPVPHPRDFVLLLPAVSQPPIGFLVSVPSPAVPVLWSGPVLGRAAELQLPPRGRTSRGSGCGRRRGEEPNGFTSGITCPAQWCLRGCRWCSEVQRTRVWHGL